MVNLPARGRLAAERMSKLNSKFEKWTGESNVPAEGFIPCPQKRQSHLIKSLEGGTRAGRVITAWCRKSTTVFGVFFILIFSTLHWYQKNNIEGNRRDPKRRKTVLFSHFYNEELLLPFWIDQHRNMFDEAMLLNFNPTDRSVDIIRNRAPVGWKVYHWGSNFDFVKFRTDFMVNEKLYPDAWKIFLTTTEFLVHDDLPRLLMHEDMPSAFRFRSYVMVGDDSKPLVDNVPLMKQRSVYTIAPFTNEMFGVSAERFNASNGKNYYYSRIMHSFDSMEYYEGLHEGAEFRVNRFSDEGFIAKFAFTPWPETIDRKRQIGSRIPKKYFENGMATHHRDNVNASILEEQREALLKHTDDFSNPKTVSARAADHRIFARSLRRKKDKSADNLSR